MGDAETQSGGLGGDRLGPELKALALRLNRRASVAGLVLVALLFLLPFCSVSCAGGNLVSYRGQQLATGGDVSVSLSSTLGGTTPSGPRTPSPSDAFAPSFLQPTAQQDQAHTDIQPLALVAAVAVVLALLVAAVIAVDRIRALALAVLAAVGGVALIVLQPVMNHAFSTSLADAEAFSRTQQTSSSFSLNIPDLTGLISLDWSAWYYIAIVGLVLVAGLNALVLRSLGASAAVAMPAAPEGLYNSITAPAATQPPPPPQPPPLPSA